MNKLTRFIGCIVLAVAVGLGGCAGLPQINPDDPTQQLLAATTIQVATSAYLEKNRKSAPLVVYITDTAIQYFKTPEAVNQTADQLKGLIHEYINNLELIMTTKIALNGLVDTLFAEALKWAKLTVTSQLDANAMKIFVWCAEQMKGVAEMYVVENARGIDG